MWVTAHAYLKYERKYMEEFSPSLAKEFMNHLKAECSSLAAIGDLAVKLKTLQIVFDITSATKYFELLLNKLQNHPLHNIDRDIDYGEWANLDGWVNKVERIWLNSSETHGYQPDESEKKEAIDTIYMSSRSFAKDKKESKAIIDEEKSKIHSAIDVLLSDVYFGGEKISVAINNALNKLTAVLSNIDNLLKNGKWEDEKYSAMVKDILNSNGKMKSLDPVFKEYKDWKDKHRKFDINMLKRKLAVELKDLFDSGFIIYDLTEIDKDRVENTFSDSGFSLIDHKENEEKIEEYKRLYYKLRLLIDFKCERYDFINMDDLGMYIFDNRHALKDNTITDMVKFIKTTLYIYDDIDKLEGNSNMSEVVKLKSKFSKEKIEVCYFKQYKEEWLAIIEEYEKELKGNKALWISVYAVLIKYKVIDDNVSQFCRFVKDYFDIRIDNSNLSTPWKDFKGKKYSDWVVNERTRRKQELANEMDNRFAMYIKSNRENITKTL